MNLKQLGYSMHLLLILLTLDGPSLLHPQGTLFLRNFCTTECLYPYDPFHIMPICCHCFLWALSYPLLDDMFESLYYAPYNFLSAHNTCIGQRPAHSRHWQIGVHDAEVCIRTLNCIKFILFLKRQKQQKNVMWTTQKFEDKKNKNQKTILGIPPCTLTETLYDEC